MNDNQPPDQVFTVAELMKRWKTSQKTILDSIHRGELRAFKVGKRAFRVTLAEVQRYENEKGAA